jgi:hypothetical protein
LDSASVQGGACHTGPLFYYENLYKTNIRNEP